MDTIPGFDSQRWRSAQDGFCAEAWQAVPQGVRRSSRGLPWQGLTVWQQEGPVEDLYLPATGHHCIIMRRGAPTGLLQRQGDAQQALRWDTGHLVIVPAGTPTFWRSERPRDNLHLDLAPTWLEKAAGRPVTLEPGFCLADPLLLQLGLSLFAALDQPTALSPGFGDAMAMAVALHLVERHGRPVQARESGCTLTARQLRRVTDYVRGHLRAPCDVARLAQEAQLSPAHFARCFKATCGLTPHQFVQQQKMEHARDLLLQGGAAVADVAQATGFASRAHFAQAFRRHWGAAPSALRRQH